MTSVSELETTHAPAGPVFGERRTAAWIATRRPGVVPVEVRVDGDEVERDKGEDGEGDEPLGPTGIHANDIGRMRIL